MYRWFVIQLFDENSERCNALFMVCVSGVPRTEIGAIVLPLRRGRQTVGIQRRSVGVLLLIL